MSTFRLVTTGLSSAVGGIFNRTDGVPYLQNIVAAVTRVKFNETEYDKPVDAPSAVKLYEDLAKAKGFQPKVVSLETGGNGFWFGSPTAKTVWFYIPGGGYVWPSVPGHLKFISNLQRAIAGDDKDFAVFYFNYVLAPEAKHPTQLKQTVAAINHLLRTTDLKPGNIMLGGDSAGGNLSLMLLSHAVHKYPDVEELDLGGQSFLATLLLCPWVNMTPEGPNIEKNKTICYISGEFLDKAGKVWLSESKIDGFTSPITNDASWWKGIPSGDIFVSGGEYEYFIDDIDAFVTKLKIQQKVSYERGDQEIHDQFVVTAEIGLPLCQTEKALRTFIAAKL